MNDGQSYNMMTLVDQIGVKKIVPHGDAMGYLRRMLTSQCFHLRNLAARTLLVFGERPRTPAETRICAQALRASDCGEALGAMVSHYYQLRGEKRELTEDAVGEAVNAIQSLVRSGPSESCYEDPIFQDPVYGRFGALPSDAAAQKYTLASELMGRHPDNWFAKVAFAGALLGVNKAIEGVQLLQSLVGKDANEPVAHLTLGTHYLKLSEFDRADALYLDAVKRWPMDLRLSSNALWSLTRDFVQPAGA